MGFMDISGQGNNYPIVPIAVPAGAAFILPPGQGVIGAFGGASSPQLGSNNPLTGQYFLQLGQYTTLQMYDIGMNYWQNINVAVNALVTISSDGANYRVVNTTGTPVAAVVTNAGSAGVNGFYGYANFGAGQGGQIIIQNGITTVGNAVFTITPSAGGGLWNAIVGGAVNATVSFSGGANVYNGNYGVNGAFGASTGGVLPSAGTNYTKAPLLIFSPPANQGAQPYILPSATCTISGGAINAVTVLDQGAGLISLPGITVVPQPGDTTGGGAVIGWLTANTGTAGLGAGTGTGTCLAMWPTFPGTALTAVPTFTFAGSTPPTSLAATAVMNWTITSITNTTPGAGYTNAFAVFGGGVTVATPATNTSTTYTQKVSNPIFPPVVVAATTGVTTLSGNGFGGVNIQATPTLGFGTNLAAGTVTTVAVQTPVMGGTTDVVKLQTF